MGDQISQTGKSTTSEKMHRQSGTTGSGVSRHRAEKQRVKVRDILDSVQAKLAVGRADDEYEREADQVAEEVMRMPDPRLQRQTELNDEEEEIQAKPLAENLTQGVHRILNPLAADTIQSQGPIIQRMCPKCEEEVSRKESSENWGVPIQAKRLSDQVPLPKGDIHTEIETLTGGGQPLPSSERDFFEPRFGVGFENVRIHNDSRSAHIARSVNARAFTYGKNLVFGEGQYSPGSHIGRSLLAHELTHVIQQGKGVRRQIQLASIRDYRDSTRWQNDPAKITDTTLRSTDEFQWLDRAYGSGVRGPVATAYTATELLLTLRLMIRDMHTGTYPVPWISVPTDETSFLSFSYSYLDRARAQSGAAGRAAGLAGSLTWTPLGPPDFSNPATARSAFTRWLLVPNAPVPTNTSTMNCWELVLYSAYSGGFTTKAHLQTIYRSAAGQTGMGVPREIERLICGSRLTLDLQNAQSREPLRGDVVVFNEFANHVAISLGTKTAGGQHEVMSLWSIPAASHSRAYRTTIETLAGSMSPPLTQVQFCSPNWS